MGFSFNWNSLNPLSYLSQGVGNFITNTFLPIIYAILALILSIYQYLLTTFLTALNLILTTIYDVSISLGPFGLPVFTSGLIFILLGIQVFFKFAHNLPVVGDFV